MQWVNASPPESNPKFLCFWIYNESGQRSSALSVGNAWVVRHSALPQLAGNRNAVAIDDLELKVQGALLPIPTPSPSPRA